LQAFFQKSSKRISVPSGKENVAGMAIAAEK
jgi:hypothetical protein